MYYCWQLSHWSLSYSVYENSRAGLVPVSSERGITYLLLFLRLLLLFFSQLKVSIAKFLFIQYEGLKTEDVIQILKPNEANWWLET